MTPLTIRHVSDWFQKLAPSSKAKRTPPIGAPNAADTPAAAPQAMKSRFTWSQRKSLNIWIVKILFTFIYLLNLKFWHSGFFKKKEFLEH